MENLRAFVAVPVSEEVKSVVAASEETLRQVGADVKWVDPRSIHITLKFLGNVEAGRTGNLGRALVAALAASQAFEFTIVGSGTFPPGKKNVRVVWLGVGEGKDQLVKTAALIDQACSTLGFAREERPFSPHLTIGRVRRESGRLGDLARAVGELQFNPLKVSADRVNLMRSELSPKGPTYTVLESFALGESGKGGGVWI